MFFFILGINTKSEEIGSVPNIICPYCGAYTSMNVKVIYEVFHLFFLPLIKWNRRYIATSYCCDTVFEIDKEEGRAFERGEKDYIDPKHLRPASRFIRDDFFADCDLCTYCGAELPQDARFCHRCGKQL